mgnify:CR=1 FL=1
MRDFLGAAVGGRRAVTRDGVGGQAGHAVDALALVIEGCGAAGKPRRDAGDAQRVGGQARAAVSLAWRRADPGEKRAGHERGREGVDGEGEGGSGGVSIAVRDLHLVGVDYGIEACSYLSATTACLVHRKHALDTELKEREVLVGSLRTALVDADAAAAAAAAAQINAEARIRDGTNELAQQLADAMERAEKARAAQRAAEATAAAAAERAALAEAEGASARREAAMAHEHVKAAEERAAAEARSTAEAREVAEAAAAEANAARSVISQARQALDSAKQELSSLRTQLDESEAARTASVEAETKALKMVEAEKSRAAEAFEAAEMAREEMKKAIAAERQRVSQKPPLLQVESTSRGW